MAEANVFNPGTNQWVNAAAINNPTGGASIDIEARAAVNTILVALRTKGVIAGAAQLNVGHTWNGTTLRNVLGGGITNPSGGVTVDANARTTIGSILTVLRGAGIIAGATAIASPVYDEDEFRWAVGAAIPDVAVGGTTDPECRTAVNAALAGMRRRGLVAID